MGFFKKTDIDKLSDGAFKYVLSVELSEKQKPRVAVNKSGVQVDLKPGAGSVSDSGIRYSLRDSYDEDKVEMLMTKYSRSNNVDNLLRDLDKHTNSTFIDCVIDHISNKQLKDSTVYKAAQLDRRLFSKMMSDRDYKPAKDTALAVAFALKLTLKEAQDLLSRAGYSLSHSNKRDIIIEYFFKESIFDLNDINAVLYQLSQKIIGR